MKIKFEINGLLPVLISRINLSWIIVWLASLASLVLLMVNQYVYNFFPVSERYNKLFVFLLITVLVITIVLIVISLIISDDFFDIVVMKEMLRLESAHLNNLELELGHRLEFKVEQSYLDNMEELKESFRLMEILRKSSNLTDEGAKSLSLEFFSKYFIPVMQAKMLHVKKKEIAEGNKSKIDKMISDGSLKILVAHPKFISKRFTSPFLVQIYDEKLESKVVMGVKLSALDEPVFHIYTSDLKVRLKVKVRLVSPVIDFSESVGKHLSSGINKINFLAKPTDLCESGDQQVLLTISDFDTGLEYHSWSFTVQVVDYLFDHVSRPMFSKISTVVLSIGSFAMFILTFLEQIDKTVGLTSGMAAGIFALGIYASFYNLYQRVRPNTP